MKPDRLEEFRKRLREGRPVTVVNGAVHLGDNAAPSKGAGGAAPGKAAAPGQGIRVKPHEWGASSASPPRHLFDSEEGQARVLLEQSLLQQHYPGFSVDVDDDGTVFAHGQIGPTETLTTRYRVLVVLPPGYGEGVMPLAWVLEPPLRKGAPHQFTDGSLCLDHSGAFTGRSTLLTFLAWVSVWLVLYEGWLATGEAW